MRPYLNIGHITLARASKHIVFWVVIHFLLYFDIKSLIVTIKQIYTEFFLVM